MALWALIFLENRIFPLHLFSAQLLWIKANSSRAHFSLTCTSVNQKLTNCVNVTSVKLEEMREELAWVKSNLLFALYLSKLQSRLNILTNVYKWETDMAYHLSGRGKFMIFSWPSSLVIKETKMDKELHQFHAKKTQQESHLLIAIWGIWYKLDLGVQLQHAGLMSVYTSTTSCHFSSLPSIFAMAHAYNRALFRDDIM